ncbi:diguanylate cyclase [Methylopila capsulata]|uniref:diguanylate cyclase n=1 Tax=Methylopila capsulata TaxID=61654 RepID=A0A9W6IRP7_9HYPH|nr:GGDEF domain-containing protein [Methylopila capsulata]MBM7849984.1 diguanylate cyclase [Methylopila capsulata]GLK55276.1 GGDEF domain-containing protein [Methylopila capsulata]
MTRGSSDFDRTLAFSDAAIQRLRVHRHAAYPRNYELWYTYATGYNSALNRAINEALEHGPGISESDLDLLYETYLSPLRLSERVDHVGTRIIEEIGEVNDALKSARGANSDYAKALESVMREAQSVDGAGGVVLGRLGELLLSATHAMINRTKALEERLSGSQNEMRKLHDTLEVIRAESLTDPLTGLANRKFLQGALDRALLDAESQADRQARFSVLLIDIDRFKTFNDSYGHLTGDQVLRLVALALKQNVKGQDLAARFGGEEFAIVLPDTGLQGAIAVAERIRRAVMTKDLVKRSTGEHLGRVTVSVGVAEWRRGDTGQTVIDRADRCMYVAKRSGRNLVIAETDPLFSEIDGAGEDAAAPQATFASASR